MTSWTFSMVDLAGYTALTETHGDDLAADLAIAFADQARNCLADGDRLIKPIGDAVLLASETPQAALILVNRLLTAAAELDGFPLARAGLNHGPAVERDGDMFGSAVNLAARVSGQAAGGQTLATRQVGDVARDIGYQVTCIGTVALRNVSEHQELFEIKLGPLLGVGSVDPVCRMWVDAAAAAGHLRWQVHGRPRHLQDGRVLAERKKLPRCMRWPPIIARQGCLLN